MFSGPAFQVLEMRVGDDTFGVLSAIENGDKESEYWEEHDGHKEIAEKPQYLCRPREQHPLLLVIITHIEDINQHKKHQAK
jgi:hypothetical protein